MSALQITLVTLACIAGLFSICCVYCAARCKAGWRVWILAFIARIYIAIMIRWSSNKPCPFPPDGAAILVGNHTSPVDPILIWHQHNAAWTEPGLRPIGFLVAEEYVVQKNIVGWVCRSMESIPIKRAGRDMAGVRKALARLKNNKWLGIFPEGHINRKPEEGLADFNTGVAFIALKSGVPVYPFFIHNAPRAESMVGCFFKRATVHITYGEPIDLTAHFGDRKLTAETLAEATQLVRQAIEQLASSNCDF